MVLYITFALFLLLSLKFNVVSQGGGRDRWPLGKGGGDRAEEKTGRIKSFYEG